MVASVAAVVCCRQRLRSLSSLRLRCVQEGERVIWETSTDARVWQQATCRLIRLGPIVSAIDLSGHRLWLWPDSSDADSLRQLRETLSGQDGRLDLSR